MTLYLIARLADRAVAIDTATVEAVVDLDTIVPVPWAGTGVRGLTALRSRVVTVIDARHSVGAAPASTAGRAVVTIVDGHHYAVLVDALEDVAELADPPVPGCWAPGSPWRAAARGVVDRDGEPIVALNLAALIPGHAATANTLD